MGGGGASKSGTRAEEGNLREKCLKIMSSKASVKNEIKIFEKEKEKGFMRPMKI